MVGHAVPSGNEPIKTVRKRAPLPEIGPNDLPVTISHGLAGNNQIIGRIKCHQQQSQLINQTFMKVSR